MSEKGYRQDSLPKKRTLTDKAKEALKNIIEDIAEEIAENAVSLAHHEGRKADCGSIREFGEKGY